MPGARADVDADRGRSPGSAPSARSPAIWPARSRCWLPPDSVETASPGWPILTPSSPDPLADQRRLLALGSISRSRPSEPVEHGDHRVVGDRLRLDQAERQPVLGHIGDAGVDGVAVGAKAAPAGRSSRIVPDPAGSCRTGDSASSVRPAPEQPGDARRSRRAGRQSETSSYSPRAREACDLQHDRLRPIGPRRGPAWSKVWPVISSVSRAWVMPAVGKTPTSRPSRSTVTRSQTSSTSASRWLTKTTAMPSAERRADDVEQRVGLGLGQRRRRLVHEDDPRVRRPAPGRSRRSGAGRSRARRSGRSRSRVKPSRPSAPLRRLAHARRS